MTTFVGDLIIPDINPFEAAQRYKASVICIALENLSPIAENIGLGEIWKGVTLTGLNGEKKYPGAPTKGARVGISMEFACVPGIGFLREDYLYPEIPAFVLDMLSHEDSKRRAFAQKRLAIAEAQVAIRQPEIEAIYRVAKVAAGQFPFRLRVAIDIQAGWAYTFEEAYRRRLAYALGFEASIAEKSLAVYEDCIPPLIANSYPNSRHLSRMRE